MKQSRKAVGVRIALTGAMFFAVFAVVALRAFQLQVLQGEKLKRLGDKQRIQEWTLQPKRGSILDRAGESLAISLEAQSVYARPGRMEDPSVAVPKLAKALRLKSRDVRRKFYKGRPFVWLKRQVTPREADKVSSLRLSGVGMYYEPKRYYPQGRLAGQMLGFVGRDSKGLEGVEAYYDRYIRGELSSSFVERDALGRRVMIQGVERLEVPPGADIYLTLDASIQYLAEKQLEAVVNDSHAKAGIAIIVEPMTGQVLALANYPFFNPNNFTRYRAERWRNRAIADSYEPGSTFKAILAAAAVEEGAVGRDDLFYCEMGRYVFGGRTIHDEKPHGWLNLDNIIKVSSNIGATKIAERLGKEKFFRYIKKFGFGHTTGIDLPGEARGLVRPPGRWSQVDLATHAFGQGIAVTPMQLVMAYAAVANGGFLMRPYVVKRVVGPGGKVRLVHESHVIRRVLSERTARVMTSVLKGTVSDGGTGVKARIEGFQVAGKTGTAQKADLIHGGYSAEKRVASFIGFVPADDPRLVLLVVLDEPQAGAFGGVVAAPLFQTIASGTLRHLGVVPRRAVRPAVPTGVTLVRVREPVGRPPSLKRSDGVPDFTGLSLREAVGRANALNLRVKIRGHGYVVEQAPAPGTHRREGEIVTMTLRGP